VPLAWNSSPPRDHASLHSRGDCAPARVARLLLLTGLFGCAARSQELRIIALPATEEARSGIPSRISIVDRAGLPVGKAWMVARISDGSGDAVFSNGLRTVLLVAGVNGIVILPRVYSPIPSQVLIQLEAMKGGLRGSTSINVGASLARTDNSWSIPKHTFRKKLPWVGAIVASGLTGYMLARRGPASAPVSPPSRTPLSIGPPVIIIGHP
jgi:hypothetical protein